MRNKTLHIRLTEQEKAEIEAEAKKYGFTVSQLVRWMMKSHKKQEEK